jgi:hypothetical protein
LTAKTHTRGRFLAGLTGLAAGATASGASARPATPGIIPLDLRYGRSSSPRISVSLPKKWFVTQQLTDVIEPVQLFSISNTQLPAPQRNVQGLANPTLVPKSAALLMVSAFKVTPDMAAWNERSGAPPSAPRLAELGDGEPFGSLGLRTRSWVHYGQRWVIQGFLWTGDNASPLDIATMDAVLQSISYDEAP